MTSHDPTRRRARAVGSSVDARETTTRRDRAVARASIDRTMMSWRARVDSSARGGRTRTRAGTNATGTMRIKCASMSRRGTRSTVIRVDGGAVGAVRERRRAVARRASDGDSGGVAVTVEPVDAEARVETAAAETAAATETVEERKREGGGKRGGGGNDDGSSRETAVLAVTALAIAAEVGALGGPESALEATTNALAGAATGLVENHAPGLGGIIEDSFLGLLTVGTVYALWRSSAIPRPIGNPIVRKSRTNASWIHVVTGAGGLAMALYAVGLERIYRESPGWTWMWVSSAMFMANALSYGPLMNIFKASKEGKYAMQLGYSFVASFQGVVWIAWSAQPDAPDWMFWAVMPYWYFSLAKLWESTEFVLALTPKPADADGLWAKVTAGSRRRLGRMTPDAATLTYVGLNAAAAVFDNCYMALYTMLGPEQFWHTSQAFNDSDFHLRLVKGTTGSLTVALLIFISTLGWRKQMPMKYAIWLNVVLGSVGPWIVLFWHKLLDPSEDWFPQFVFDPDFAYHVYLNPSVQLFGN